MIEKNYEYPRETERYGHAIVTGSASDLPGVCHVIGSKENGILIHQDILQDTLSDAAIKEGITIEDFLYYPDKTIGPIVEYELSGKGNFRHSKREFSALENILMQRHPEYCKAVMHPETMKRIEQRMKRSAKKPQQPER